MKLHENRNSRMLGILKKHCWNTVGLAIGSLIAAGGVSALDLNEIGAGVLPTKYPALSDNWAAEKCDFLADLRVTVDGGDASDDPPDYDPPDYIALAQEVDRAIAEAGGNGYIWLSVGWAKDRQHIAHIAEPFVDIRVLECEVLPWAKWQELTREFWPEPVEDTRKTR